VLSEYLRSESTPPIDQYLEGPGAGLLWKLLEADSTAVNYILGALLVAFSAAYVASLVGLVLLKPWARRLYVALFIVGACTYPLYGSTLVDSFSATVGYLAGVCSGAILATLFLSDARVAFDVRTPNTSFERTREG
jgi:hypothetical protein